MQTDLISFCSNIDSLIVELIEKKHIDDNGNPIFPLLNKTQTQKKNNTTVTLIRVTNSYEEKLLESFDSIEILGTKEQVDSNKELTTKYELAYSRKPYTVINPESGEEKTITPPHWHGDFL